jgi:hypothetical protein
MKRFLTVFCLFSLGSCPFFLPLTYHFNSGKTLTVFKNIFTYRYSKDEFGIYLSGINLSFLFTELLVAAGISFLITVSLPIISTLFKTVCSIATSERQTYKNTTSIMQRCSYVLVRTVLIALIAIGAATVITTTYIVFSNPRSIGL